MTFQSVPTFTATIFVGLRSDGSERSIDEVYEESQAYCDRVGLCVTVTLTRFVYTNGNEPGAVVGLINYPRFPSSKSDIREHALALAGRLKDRLCQKKVSVVMPDETVMLADELM